MVVFRSGAFQTFLSTFKRLCHVAFSFKSPSGYLKALERGPRFKWFDRAKIFKFMLFCCMWKNVKKICTKGLQNCSNRGKEGVEGGGSDNLGNDHIYAVFGPWWPPLTMYLQRCLKNSPAYTGYHQYLRSYLLFVSRAHLFLHFPGPLQPLRQLVYLTQLPLTAVLGGHLREQVFSGFMQEEILWWFLQ